MVPPPRRAASRAVASRALVIAMLAPLVAVCGAAVAMAEASGGEGGAVHKEVRLARSGTAGFVFEEELEVHTGGRIAYRYSVLSPAGAAVEFAFHYHQGNKTYVYDDRVAAEGHGEVTVASDQVYYLEWVNTNPYAIEVSVQYEVHDLTPVDGTPYIIASLGVALILVTVAHALASRAHRHAR